MQFKIIFALSVFKKIMIIDIISVRNVEKKM